MLKLSFQIGSNNERAIKGLVVFQELLPTSPPPKRDREKENWLLFFGQ